MENMMTFEEKMKNLLVANGMFESQADGVITMAKTHDALYSFADNWQKDISTYPDMMVNVVWMGIKRVAVLWIDEHMPQAWYREMFAS